MKKYDVAAYIWPAYTGDEPRTRIFWAEGIGEWQTVKNFQTKKCGYSWNRKPLWGYVNEADPYVMSMQIEAAVAHGVNTFIYDWYWYDNRPFLENCLNDGFLKAPNCHKMKFYLMWANHDATCLWDKRNSDEITEPIWKGAVNRKQFETIGRRWIERYFGKENYYTINGKPVVSIYELKNFVEGFGSVEAAAEAMQWLDREACKAGLAGVHFQFIRYGSSNVDATGADGNPIHLTANVLEEMGFASLTHYQFASITNIDRDYESLLPDVKTVWDTIRKEHTIPFYPLIAVGWDNNLRFKEFVPGIITNNTPEQFEKALRMAKQYADQNEVPLITINSWNEWTEDSYLEPDDRYGYGHLEAVKRVFLDQE